MSWLLPLVLVLSLVGRWAGQHPDGVVGAWNDVTQTADGGLLTPMPPALRNAPPSGREEADTPLGSPPAPVDPGAPHAFTETRTSPDGRTVPVTWSPCRPIHYVVDTTGAPVDFADHVAAAIRELSAASGLVFINDGTTIEPASASRDPFQPDRYGDRWAPALVRFADASAIPEFADRYSGLGGPIGASGSATGPLHFVSGFAYLDSELLQHPDIAGEPAYVGVLRHELGHMVGLGHVRDPTQLMFGEGNAVTTYQTGDLAGLAALGTGPCAPEV